MADRAVPNLPSRDLGATSAFYAGFGFVENFRDDKWMIMRCGTIEIEFFPYPELLPRESSFMCSIRVGDVDDLYDRMRSCGIPESETEIPRLTPIALRPWGQRAGFLVDLDGTQVHLIEDSV